VRRELNLFRDRVTKLLSWSMPPDTDRRDVIDDILLAIASALRIEVLQHNDEGMLRFLTLSEALVRRVFVMAQAPPSVQGVYGVIEDMKPAIRLLAWSDEVPSLKKMPLKSPEFGNPNLVSSAQKFLNWLPSRGVLPALEKAFDPRFTAADRTVLVRQTADIVEPALRRRS